METRLMPLPGIQQFFRNLTVCTLVMGLAGPQTISAQAHVVSQEELRAAIVAATQARGKNYEKVVSFLSTPKAMKALGTTQLDLKRVTSAVSSLSDAELADLAARAQKAEADFAAGRISDRDLLWILIGIAALILIIVAVG
jgi:hypothetical protein